MRRTHFVEGSGVQLEDFLSEARELGAGEPGRAIFHLYVDSKDRSRAERLGGIIGKEFPGAAFVGSSTVGNIVDGAFTRSADGPRAMVLCDVFEHEDTRVELMQMKLDYDCQHDTAAALVAAVGERPWVKAVEMHACVGGADVPGFCAALSAVRPDIEFFGGAALSPEQLDVTTHLPYVFSSEGDIDSRAVVFALYGGEDFHVQTCAITGWKPLGRPFQVTRTERSTLYELDGEPAYEVYDRYLHIPNDENFFNNGLVFPLVFDRNGMTIIKAPSVANADGSLVMTSDVSDDLGECRIAYGDPATILDSVRESALQLHEFAPEVISVYTCSARMIYWGDDYVSREYLPFQAIAPTDGWFTGSEFVRHDGEVLQCNVTLVLAGLREGPAHARDDFSVQVEDAEFNRQMALVRSLTAFVGTTSAELQEAYDRMEVMAKTDGLTGLADRREIESQIEGAIKGFLDSGAKLCERDGGSKAPCLIMFDLDDFKVVNDAYGHKAGDDVLKGLGDLMREIVDDAGCGVSGRWGGEEFMVLLPETTVSQAEGKAEELRTRFSGITFPSSGSHTLSLGVAQALPGESADLLCSRADKALYAAKKRGKNCVVVS